MARTPVQVEDAMIASTQIIDPGIDATKGPHRGAFIQPQAQIISQTEQLVDDLSLRYSLRYVQTRNPAVMDLYAFNHGLAAGLGSPSKTTLYFYTFTVPEPGGYVFIPSGTVVATADATVSFQTTTDLTVAANAFPLYYNNTTRRYEFPVAAASIGVGPEFEIAARRLVTLQTSLAGIVGVVQPFRSSPSAQIEQAAQLAQRQQTKFTGLSLGTSAGLESTVRNFDTSNILDVSVVYSTEYDLFRRPLNRPGFDVYVVGNVSDTATETFRSAGGELKFYLSKTPVQNLNSVVINGTAVTAQLVRDNLPATGNSVRALDYLLLQAPTDPGSTIQVSYTYNRLLTDISDFITKSNQRYWRADILIRAGRQVPMAITVDASALSTVDTLSLISSIQLATFTYTNRNLLGLTLFPDGLRQAINSTVAGLSASKITLFTRLDQGGVLPVDVQEMNKTEYPFVSPGDLTINVRS